MKTSQAQINASVKYNKSRDSITIRPDKGTGALIRAAAEKSGVSVTEFILKAVSDRIATESTTAPTAPTEPAAESAEPDGGGVSRKHK